MIVSTTATDRDLRYCAMWWRKMARDDDRELTASERERYKRGASQIETVRRTLRAGEKT